MIKTIAIITGGYSGESVISYKTAEAIKNNIDSKKWKHYTIDITAVGWFYTNASGEKIAIDKNDFSLLLDGNKIVFDAALIALHGTPGEDGKLQGYFDCLNIPYTSCDAATSALTFNKRYTVAVAAFAGIPVAKSILIIKNSFINADEIKATLNFPVFVKPNNGGSSIGISKVNGPDETLDIAIAKAFKEDNQVLVEEFIKGREFTIGVFKTKKQIIALPITEILTHNNFFDYEAKYNGESEEITPANVSEIIADKVRQMAKKVYTVFNCNGIVGIDFIYDEKTAQPYMLEINTVPGQTSASLVPQQVKVMGWSLTEFYSALIDECFN